MAPLDLAVPIGALDEAQHEPAMVAARQRRQPVDERQPPLLIGLNRHAEPVPAGKIGRARKRRDEIEREIETVGLLGVDGEADADILGLAGERQQHGRQIAQHSAALAFLVARMQRRQLDRDAGRVVEAAARDTPADGGDRLVVSRRVARGILGGARRLAQHVVRKAIALCFGGRGAVERLGDGAAHDELVPQDAHRRRHRLAQHRLAAARDEPA